MATKNGRTKTNFPPFGAFVGSGIRDPGWIKIRIWDRHPGSAALDLPEHSNVSVSVECQVGSVAVRTPILPLSDILNLAVGIIGRSL